MGSGIVIAQPLMRSGGIGPAMHRPFQVALRSLQVPAFQRGLTGREKSAQLENFSLDGLVIVGEGRGEFAAHPMCIRAHDVEFLLTKCDASFAQLEPLILTASP